MRFSLKYILAATAYVALAAAAFTQPTWVYADLLWVVTFLAFVYALLSAYFTRGKRRATWLGFVVAAGCYVACVQFAPNGAPTGRFIKAILPRPSAPISPADRGAIVSDPSFTVAYIDDSRRRAAHSIATMLCGLVGCWLGSLAYTRAGREAKE